MWLQNQIRTLATKQDQKKNQTRINETENPETPNGFPEEKPDVAPEMPEKTPETNITAKEISTQKDEKKESQKINTTIRQINEEKQNTHTTIW